MRFDSLSVLKMLQDLEQQVGEYQRYMAHVATALGGGNVVVAREATEALRRALDAIVETTASLQQWIVPSDGLGGNMESLAELVIRSRRMVITAQTDVLRDVLRGSNAAERAQGWFIGRFRHVDHLADFFANEFYRINSIWMQYRQDDRRAAAMDGGDRVTLYTTALRVAQQAMRELRQEPSLAHFLEKGTAANGWPEVETACKQISAALAIPINMELTSWPPGRLHTGGDGPAARKS